MLSKNHHIAQAPQYVHQFKCIGSSCPDTCCNGWSVDIDKNTFKKMRDLKGTELASRVKKYFKINPEGRGNSFARVTMGSDLKCPMQNEEKLCSIQVEIGAEYLSHTCKTYPRKIVQNSLVKEMYTTLSCPEAARLCLLSQDDWSLKPLDLGVPIGKPMLVQAGFKKEAEGTTSFNFEMIRAFTYELCRGRNMPSWKRMLLLGLTCQKIDAMVESKPENFDAHLEQCILESRLSSINGTFSEQVENILPIAKVKHLQASLIKLMTEERLRMTRADQRPFFNETFIRCIKQTVDGYNKSLKASNQMDELTTFARFEQFDASKPHILENYLINGFFSSLFPMGNKSSLVNQWGDQMIRYALIRFYLKGMSESLGSDFSEKDCVDLIYSFAKVIEHNSTFLPRIKAMLKEADIDGIATIAILIR